jgi:hypothetical protein
MFRVILDSTPSPKSSFEYAILCFVAIRFCNFSNPKRTQKKELHSFQKKKKNNKNSTKIAFGDDSVVTATREMRTEKALATQKTHSE